MSTNVDAWLNCRDKKTPFPEDRGKLTNIDYQTNWIYEEIQKTNQLIIRQNSLIEQQTKVNHYLVRLIEHMLEKSDNFEKMREAVKVEMGRGIR